MRAGIALARMGINGRLLPIAGRQTKSLRTNFDMMGVPSGVREARSRLGRLAGIGVAPMGDLPKTASGKFARMVDISEGAVRHRVHCTMRRLGIAETSGARGVQPRRAALQQDR